MAAAWKGAIEFGGFPVNVALSNRVKSRSGESFKSLAPTDKQPIRSVYLDTKGKEVARADVIKGVKVGKDQYQPLSDQAVEQIASAEKSAVVTPDSFAPLASVPLELATAAFFVTPDKDVAGAAKSVNLLWNGLRSTEQAYITTITMRAGSRDAILALYATDDGMFAVALPYEAELNDAPAFAFEVDEKAEQVFAQFLENAEYDQGAFNHGEFVSAYRERRQAAIDAALAGKAPDAAPQAEAPAADGPDLMAALENAVAAKPAKKKAKAKASKPRAKVAA